MTVWPYSTPAAKLPSTCRIGLKSVNGTFRYQLTAIGAPGPNLYISQEVSNNQFTIAGGEPGMKVSWQVLRQ
jgi:hypothetical protein